MAIDVFSAAVGFVVGALIVAIAIETGMRRRNATEVLTKLTSGWRLAEFGEPLLVAHDVVDVRVPAGSTIMASGTVDPTLMARCTVRHVPPVRAEFALDPKGQRALLFTGGLAEGALAVWTVDPAIVERLASEYKTLQSRAGDYVERHSIAQLAGRTGVTVETRGVVADVLPYKGRYLVRLEDQGHVIGVVVDAEPEGIRDERVVVRGHLRRDANGYATIEAEELRRIR